VSNRKDRGFSPPFSLDGGVLGGNVRKLILENFQSPGDIVMLTAAVRDLHRCHPGEFLTDVRTSCPEIWRHNPHLTPLSADDPEVQVLDCHYPLIHRSNQEPRHFLDGFVEYLNEQLGLKIRVTAFKGDLHIHESERHWFRQIEALEGDCPPFWLFASGGKYDYTIKWWSTARFQSVVDHFRGRLLFVQVGEAGDHHPPLDHVLDLRGRTDLRDLVQLVHRADGVLCPVTSLMHLAAAVETPAGRPPERPCIVVAGGREPPHWEAYPHHQFLHTVGMLPCCARGGCWRSRTHPLGDGDEKDAPESLCVDPVGDLPRCMDFITADDVIRQIERHCLGGTSRVLDAAQAEAVLRALAREPEPATTLDATL